MVYTKIDEIQIKDWLKNNLNDERYSHSLGTAGCAKELAGMYGINQEKAYIAGLLHDCAKCFSNEKLLDIIKNNLEVDECEMLNYKTLHAPVSAYYAEKEFGVTDKEILSAIRWHTLGQIEMSDFEKMRYEVQLETMQTGKRDEEKYKKMQDLYSELVEIDDAKKFFEAETKFNIVIADVNKIIGEAIKDVMQ